MTSLDGPVDVRRLALPLELEDALRYGRDDGIVPSFDVRQQTRKPLVVVVHLGRPNDILIRIRVVSADARSAHTHPCSGRGMNPPVKGHLLPTLLALQLVRPRLHVFGQGGIRNRFRDALRFLRCAEEGFGEMLRELRPRKAYQLLHEREKCQ